MQPHQNHLDSEPLTRDIDGELFIRKPLVPQRKARGLRSGISKSKVRPRHTGWAIAVGKKQAEKVGVPLHNLFFETKPQDIHMLMRRPLVPRPDTPAQGASISVDGDEIMKASLSAEARKGNKRDEDVRSTSEREEVVPYGENV